jgi:hypothetical protein
VSDLVHRERPADSDHSGLLVLLHGRGACAELRGRIALADIWTRLRASDG